MRVDWISLTSFRSHHNLDWALEPGTNILIGANGAGKTNVLEAIAYLAKLRSFRGVADAELISDGSGTAIVRASISSADRERLVEIQLQHSGPRRVQVDKNPIKRTADMLDVLRVVTFLPDDLDLVKRGPSYRRDLIDETAGQLWPAALADQAEYARALKQRNAFLKAGQRDDNTLAVWDSRLAQAGGKVLSRRARTLGVLSDLLETAYKEIAGSGQRAHFTYHPSWGSETLDNRTAADYTEEMAKALEWSRQLDTDRRLTTVGPHRDEPGFCLDDVDTRTHGSQGEQRSMSLAMRLATHRAISATLSEPPVLLLDDVFSELDADRSEALAASLPGETQTIISTARPEDVPVGGVRWIVDGGVHLEG